MMRARAALVASLRDVPLRTRVRAIGAMIRAELPRPANDR